MIQADIPSLLTGIMAIIAAIVWKRIEGEFIVQLEDMIRDEMGHSEETERILCDWPL